VLLLPSARAAASRQSSAFGHHQIVAMNDLVASTVAEYGNNFTTLVSCDAADVDARVGRETAAGLGPVAGTDDHRIAAVERPFDRNDASGQQALAAAQRAGGAVIDDDRTRWADRPGDPRFARRAGLAARQKERRSITGFDRRERARGGGRRLPPG